MDALLPKTLSFLAVMFLFSQHLTPFSVRVIVKSHLFICLFVWVTDIYFPAVFIHIWELLKWSWNTGKYLICFIWKKYDPILFLLFFKRNKWAECTFGCLVPIAHSWNCIWVVLSRVIRVYRDISVKGISTFLIIEFFNNIKNSSILSLKDFSIGLHSWSGPLLVSLL